MAITTPAKDKLADTGGSVERGHAAWKRAKIERGLAEAQDRSRLIPAEQLLRELGIER
jgi:hypothetical protein